MSIINYVIGVARAAITLLTRRRGRHNGQSSPLGGAPVNGQHLPAGGRVLGAGASISLITAGVVLRFALPAASPYGLNVHAVGIILMLAGALGLLLSLLVWGPPSPARRRGDSPGYDGGTPMLVRAEKRLYQGELPLGDERRIYSDKPPL
jgi:hypothetical protein